MSGVSPRTSGVSWYDLLGVSRDASTQEIKRAWRDATDKFEPGSGTGQFRLFNEAADVLLDPTRRAAYDEELGAPAGSAPVAVAPEPTLEPVPAVVLDKETASTGSGSASVGHSDSSAPAWLMSLAMVLVMALLAVLTVGALGVGGYFWHQHRTDNQAQDAGQEATAAAERALPVILSYDYRHLAADRDHAAQFLTPRYKKEYTATFDKLIESTGTTPGPAEQTKAVVTATVENIGVVRAEPGQVRVIAFLNQSTTKAGGTPQLSLNRLTVSMTRSGNSWLVENISSY